MYMADTLTDAYKALIGNVQAGAEAPYATAEQLLQDLIEQFYEETATAFQPATWHAYCQTHWDFSVKGTLDLPQISSGQ